jgi:hypothetical protein
MGYNSNIFQGWVKQPSPCCAASSVAGAWNALHGYHRTNSKALQYFDVLAIYQNLVDEKITKKVNMFNRKLGYYGSGSSLVLSSSSNDGKDAQEVDITTIDLNSDHFWNIFNQYALELYGKQLGGKKENIITKKVMEKVLLEMIFGLFLKSYEKQGILIREFKDLNPENRSFFYCLIELYELDNQSLFGSQAGGSDSKKLQGEEEETTKDRGADDSDEVRGFE